MSGKQNDSWVEPFCSVVERDSKERASKILCVNLDHRYYMIVEIKSGKILTSTGKTPKLYTKDMAKSVTAQKNNYNNRYGLDRDVRYVIVPVKITPTEDIN